MRDPKTFYFEFHWFKDIDENFKHVNEFITKNNEYLAGNKIKSEVEKLLLKCNHGNDIHEHGKQQNEWTSNILLNLPQRLYLGLFPSIKIW